MALINRTLLTKRQLKILDASKKPPGWIYGLARREKDKQQRWRRKGTPFLVGQRQVFLPAFRITLLRTPGLPPTQAQFLVPLSFNKLDLRDYLFHTYSVRVFSVRSFIKQHPLTQVEPGTWRDLPGKKRRFRPKGTKKMVVELEKPFVWPEPPKDFSKWDKDRYEALERDRKRQGYGMRDEERRQREQMTIGEQAQRLLEGKERWKGVDQSIMGGKGIGFELPLR